ncbi:hypothetical protein D3C79_914450 [compost metagenome]
MLRVERGTDVPGWLVEHQVARWPPGLQQLLIHFDAAELTHRGQRVGRDDAIDPHTALHQQQANLLAVVTGQVGKETVKAHGEQGRRSGRAV